VVLRTFGIDFYSVLSRGSQYRVESLLVRLAHTNNFLLPSPSKEQVMTSNQRLRCLCDSNSKQQSPPLAWHSSSVPSHVPGQHAGISTRRKHRQGLIRTSSVPRARMPCTATCAQVGGQPAMEALPLVMEPESRLYTSPVVVLDFQSLYPSQV
jgi:hypothetical protein